jgi:hypothetical protein
MRKFLFFTNAFLLLLMALTTAPVTVRGGPGTEINFNPNAMRHYRNKDYEGALKDVREYIALDPDNRAKKQFAVNLLLEMATNSHLEKRDAQALEFLKEARSYEDNQQIKELYRTIQEALQPPMETISPKTAADLYEAAPHDEYSLDSLIRNPETSSPKPRKTKQPAGAPTVKPKIARISQPASPDIPDTPRITADTGGTLPTRRPTPTVAGPVALSVPSWPVRILMRVSAIAAALILFFAGAAFFYLRQIRKRLLQDPSLKIQEEWLNLQKEKARIKEENERMEKAAEERLAREKERMETEAKQRQEAREKEEREHQKQLEELQIIKSDLIAEKERMIKETEPRLKAPKNTKAISETLFIVDAQEAARELTYKNLAARLLAYKRFASQLRDIYELNKENAMDSIKPLLNDPDPHIRVYLAGGLSQLPIPEFAVILLQLWNDSDANVKCESLRGLLNFSNQRDFTGIFPESLQIQIKQLVEQEKKRNKWVF